MEEKNITQGKDYRQHCENYLKYKNLSDNNKRMCRYYDKMAKYHYDMCRFYKGDIKEMPNISEEEEYIPTINFSNPYSMPGMESMNDFMMFGGF